MKAKKFRTRQKVLLGGIHEARILGYNHHGFPVVSVNGKMLTVNETELEKRVA